MKSHENCPSEPCMTVPSASSSQPPQQRCSPRSVYMPRPARSCDGCVGNSLCVLGRSRPEAVLELPGDGLERPHAAGAGGLSPLGLLAPVVCARQCRAAGSPGLSYTCECSRMGSRRTSRCASGCAWTGDLAISDLSLSAGRLAYRNDDKSCAICCVAYRTTRYLSLQRGLALA